MFGLGSDELHAVLGKNFGKARIFREKPVARVDRIGAGDLAGREERWNIEIAVPCRRRANADALVGKPHVHGIGIGGRVHGDRWNAELLAGAQDPECDLATIGDENFVEHPSSAATRDQQTATCGFCRHSILCEGRLVAHSMITSGSPNSTG